MRHRPVLTALAALVSIGFVVAGCGGDDDGDKDTSETTEAEVSTTTAPVVDCGDYVTLIGLFGEADQIASGGNESQVAADEALGVAVAELTTYAAGDEELSAALATLGEVSFQVTDDPDAGPAPEDVEAALETVEDAWSGDCPVEETTETTEGAEGSEGSEPAEGEGEATPECPAPEVLEAEGFSCDSEGNLTPLDEETTTECPAPEVLEAEGFTCDSEGNLTPIPEESDSGSQAGECPPPEALEANGLQCDAEGNVTPIE